MKSFKQKENENDIKLIKRVVNFQFVERTTSLCILRGCAFVRIIFLQSRFNKNNFRTCLYLRMFFYNARYCIVQMMNLHKHLQILFMNLYRRCRRAIFLLVAKLWRTRTCAWRRKEKSLLRGSLVLGAVGEFARGILLWSHRRFCRDCFTRRRYLMNLLVGPEVTFFYIFIANWWGNQLKLQSSNERSVAAILLH